MGVVLSDILLERDANNALISILRNELSKKQDRIYELESQHYVVCRWFWHKRENDIPDFVEHVYASDKDLNRREQMELVRSFHDETLDLSTLPCTGEDFTPWESHD